MWMSVPQIVVSRTRTTASPGPAFGIGFSSSPNLPGPRKTLAFMKPRVTLLMFFFRELGPRPYSYRAYAHLPPKLIALLSTTWITGAQREMTLAGETAQCVL